MAFDIGIDNSKGADLDLLATNGDFTVQFSDPIHCMDMAQAAPGHYKESPWAGLNSFMYINSSGKQSEMTSSYQKLLKKDGFINVNLVTAKVDGGQLDFNVPYNVVLGS